MKLIVGDLVLVYGYKAYARFIPQKLDGKSNAASGRETSVGVEFEDRHLGNTDGVLKGVRYFSCNPQRGRFVHTKFISAYSPELYLALTAQRLFRGHAARISYLEEISFKFWNALECLEEKEALVNNRDIGQPVASSIRRLSADEDLESPISASSASFIAPDGDDEKHPFIAQLSMDRPQKLHATVSNELEDFTVQEYMESIYNGPHLQWPITKEFAFSLMGHFRDHPDMKLPHKYGYEIMMQMRKLLKATVSGAVFQVTIPENRDCKLVLVGDTHGQLNDVLWLFYKFGPPSAKNIYVFNGDIADRGKYATEIFFLLFVFKLLNSDSVVINRGNHESGDMNEVYGFAREVRTKYSGVMYKRFQDIFNLLPLAVIIQKRVIVVHGGLFRKDNVTLSHLDQVNRCKGCPSSPSTYEDTLMFDALWSDPRAEPGRGFSSRGADCISFGPDVTEAFLKLNNLEVCIRSHQVPSNLRGFEPLHDGRCVTLFSASNYCGTTGNYGGVVIFESDMSFEIQEYMAPTLEVMKKLHKEMETAVRKVLSHSRMKELEAMARISHKSTAASKMSRDIHSKLNKLICERKEELWSIFRNYDTFKTGFIRPAHWRAACCAVVDDNLPWVFFMKLLRVNPNVDINYSDFLKRFRIDFMHPSNKHDNWREDCVSQVYESILAADLSMKEMQLVLDRGYDGAVSLQDFRELLTELRIGLSEPQIKILMRIITANCAMDGDKVDIAEFLGRFKVYYSKDILKNVPGSSWVSPALQVIGKAILADKTETAHRYFEEQDVNYADSATGRRRSSALRAVALFQKFQDFDTSGSGYLSYEEFANAISSLPLRKLSEELPFQLTLKSIMTIAETIDITGSGKINYFEFLQAFYVADNNSKVSVAAELWSHICSVLFRNKSSIRSALHQIDSGYSGKIDLYHFRAALETLNNVLGFTEAPLTQDQIESLTTFIDIDRDGLFDYEEFLDCFKPIDTLDGVVETSFGDSEAGSKPPKFDSNGGNHFVAPVLSRRRRGFLNEYQFVR